ncbi:MAG: HAD family hydrolase [Armatimonadetes bacterium]|nr:HAD family hydrolase [Armatimonadota bacterium]
MSSKMREIKAVFFDLDDTLCAYWEAAKQALGITFERFAPEGHSAESMIALWSREFDGYCHGIKKTPWYEPYLKSGEPTRTELMRLTYLAAGIDDPKLAREVGDFYAVQRRSALQLFDDALPALDKLEGRFYLGMITNGPADVQREEVVDLGLEPRFQSILIEGELGFGKPLEEIFRLAERESGCSSRECLFIGNSFAHDILPAIRAGWKTVWVRRESDVPPSRNGEGARLEDLPPGTPEPDMIVESLDPVVEALLGQK